MQAVRCGTFQRAASVRAKPTTRTQSSLSQHGSRRLLYARSGAQEIAQLALDGAQAGKLAAVLRPTLTVVELLFIVRIPMTWSPALNTGKKLPWAIFYKSTEPVLALTRKVIQPIGGVDVTPIVWVFVISFLNEILLGPQGLLVLIEMQGGL